MKILLLEDDAVLAESLKEYLELEGYEVDTVRSGEEVFDHTFEQRYDLYILDINVPDINGLEVLKALKEADDSTPAIYISAMTEIEYITQGFEAGAVDYLKKPFNPEELLVRLQHHLREKEETILYKDIVYYPKNGRIDLQGESFYLSEIQKKIFDRLILSIGDIVSSDELMEFLDKPSPNALRVAITKLKKKLNIDIKNIRSQGYTLEAL